METNRPNQRSWTILMIECLTAGLMALSAFADPGKNGPKDGTVLIIRHGEKPADCDPSPHLSYVGEERAQKYVGFFKDLKIDGKYATPTFVFATKESKNSDRPWKTVKHLVEELSLPHDHSVKNDDFSQVVSQLKAGPYDGKIVLVCWHHGNIRGLLDLLGANSNTLLGGDKWPGKPPRDVFGWLVELQFDAIGTLKSSIVVNEHLMDDDAIDPPSSK